MHRTIIVGSPQADGRCAVLANEIFESCIEECPDDGVSVLSVSSIDVSPCIGCNACKEELPKDDERYGAIPEKGDPLEQNPLVFKSDACAHQCFIDDEMSEVRKHIDAADEVIVVAPVYFSGAPAQLKALLDRMQPYFFSDIRSRTSSRRQATLHVVREGGDPYGFGALESVVASALSVAGIKLDYVLDWLGCFNEEGEIISDPVEYDRMTADPLSLKHEYAAGEEASPVDAKCESGAKDEPPDGNAAMRSNDGPASTSKGVKKRKAHRIK